MRLALLAAFFGSGCDCSEQAACFGASANFGSIQSKIFDHGCNNFTDCHNPSGMTSAAQLDLCSETSEFIYCGDGSARDRLVDVEASCEEKIGDVDDESCILGETVLVIPGNPDDSYLYRRVTGRGLTKGVHHMPWGSEGNGLCDEDANAIRSWIAAGAPP